MWKGPRLAGALSTERAAVAFAARQVSLSARKIVARGAIPRLREHEIDAELAETRAALLDASQTLRSTPTSNISTVDRCPIPSAGGLIEFSTS